MINYDFKGRSVKYGPLFNDLLGIDAWGKLDSKCLLVWLALGIKDKL